MSSVREISFRNNYAPFHLLYCYNIKSYVMLLPKDTRRILHGYIYTFHQLFLGLNIIFVSKV